MMDTEGQSMQGHANSLAPVLLRKKQKYVLSSILTYMQTNKQHKLQKHINTKWVVIYYHNYFK